MGALAVARITAEDLPEVLDRLAGRPRENLLLLDLAQRLGGPAQPGEMASELVGAWRRGALVGVASVRPTLAFDAEVGPAALDALVGSLESLRVGLVKCDPRHVERLWQRLRRRRHRLWIDRLETALALEPDAAQLVPVDAARRVRRAVESDLDPLVFAAHESLREEDRPDPFAGDVDGFRRWVRGRVGRAWVVEEEGRVRFVGYADVRRPEGWLLQGIYTWPEARRRGHAAEGTSALCREAFAAGASHVQLAVVDGNETARRLYERLGFKPFARLRTLLFT